MDRQQSVLASCGLLGVAIAARGFALCVACSALGQVLWSGCQLPLLCEVGLPMAALPALLGEALSPPPLAWGEGLPHIPFNVCVTLRHFSQQPFSWSSLRTQGQVSCLRAPSISCRSVGTWRRILSANCLKSEGSTTRLSTPAEKSRISLFPTASGGGQ